jgi:hypothetical protein
MQLKLVTRDARALASAVSRIVDQLSWRTRVHVKTLEAQRGAGRMLH